MVKTPKKFQCNSISSQQDLPKFSEIATAEKRKTAKNPPASSGDAKFCSEFANAKINLGASGSCTLKKVSKERVN